MTARRKSQRGSSPLHVVTASILVLLLAIGMAPAAKVRYSWCSDQEAELDNVGVSRYGSECSVVMIYIFMHDYNLGFRINQ